MRLQLQRQGHVDRPAHPEHQGPVEPEREHLFPNAAALQQRLQQRLQQQPRTGAQLYDRIELDRHQDRLSAMNRTISGKHSFDNFAIQTVTALLLCVHQL